MLQDLIMGKARKRFLSNLRSGKRDEHWLGHGIDGQDALLFDLDPYLYALDAQVCRVSQQVAHAAEQRLSKGERPKAAILLGFDLNPWSVGFLSERFDVVLVTEFVDPIVEETAQRFGALVLGEEEFYGMEPIFDFVLSFSCSSALEPAVIKSIFDVSQILVPEGVALFPFHTTEKLSADVKASWLSSTLGFREYATIEVFQTSFPELKTQPDYGVSEFARRHRPFYGKESRDLCLKRIYEEDFQEIVQHEDEVVELVIAVR